MQKSLLLEIFQCFSKKEWRELEKWLQSPVHNQREDIRRLYAYITENWNHSPEIDKKEAWKAIYPKENYQDDKMRQVMHFLTLAAEDYLSYSGLCEDPIGKDLSLAGFYRRKQTEKPFTVTTNSVRRRLEAQPLRNQLYLDYVYQLERETSTFRSNQRRDDSLHLQETADALDLSYIATKLRISCAMLSHRSVNAKMHYDEGLLPYILSYIEAKNLVENPAIAGFYYGYMLSTRQTGADYFGLLTAFMEKNHAAMSLEELRELYRMALNYCIFQVNTGAIAYSEAALQLYRSGFDRGVLLDENGQVSRFTFVNVIGMAIKVGAFAWAEGFIEDHQGKLDIRHRENIVKFNLARVYFERKDYEKAQRLLVTFEYDELLFTILAKTMLLKIYYEEDEWDALESLIGSMGAFLKRKETLDENRRLGYRNFLKIVRKLIHLKPSARAAREQLATLVANTQPLMEREWLNRVLIGV